MDEPTTTQLLEQAQSTCTAWRDAFDCIEAHLRDRIEAGDEAGPERYLRIIQSEVQNVARESEAIVNARWADAARARDEIGRLRSANDVLLAALEAARPVVVEEIDIMLRSFCHLNFATGESERDTMDADDAEQVEEAETALKLMDAAIKLAKGE